jgi:hypothetical protein
MVFFTYSHIYAYEKTQKQDIRNNNNSNKNEIIDDNGRLLGLP